MVEGLGLMVDGRRHLMLTLNTQLSTLHISGLGLRVGSKNGRGLSRSFRAPSPRWSSRGKWDCPLLRDGSSLAWAGPFLQFCHGCGKKLSWGNRCNIRGPFCNASARPALGFLRSGSGWVWQNTSRGPLLVELPRRRKNRVVPCTSRAESALGRAESVCGHPARTISDRTRGDVF
jgi:hypothetical protein